MSKYKFQVGQRVRFTGDFLIGGTGVIGWLANDEGVNFYSIKIDKKIQAVRKGMILIFKESELSAIDDVKEK